MKQNIFRMTKSKLKNQRSGNQVERPTIAELRRNKEIVQMMTMYQNIIKQQEEKSITLHPKQYHNLEVRDQEILVSLSEIYEEKKQRSKSLERWCGKIIQLIVSSAFNSYYNKSMTFEQSKIFCAENILKNLVLANKEQLLTANEFERISYLLQKKILEYMMVKYPLTDTFDVDKQLQASIKETDTVDQLANDYLAHTNLVFQYRESANYNDLIMKMINQVLTKVQSESTKPAKNNFDTFPQCMESIFKKIEDEQWMNSQNQQPQELESVVNIQDPNNQSQRVLDSKAQQTFGFAVNLNKTDQNQETLEDKKQKEKQKKLKAQEYRSKVKGYSFYLIGNKIPKNVNHFDAKQIQSGLIVIRHPSILRVLMKWCEELWGKFTNNTYFINDLVRVKLQKGNNTILLAQWMKQQLDALAVIEKNKIEDEMKQIQANNFEMQRNLLFREINDETDLYIDELEKASGKFAFKMVKNLHSYVIIYLNKLIHSLMTISKVFYKKNKGHLNKGEWPYPPNLISFRLGDLLRCKCHSKEKQIIKIFNEIERISKAQPNKLKVVRIKNRLRKGTNDILMNIRYKNKALCEVQLAVASKTTQFMHSSNQYSHFMYELQRSLFGPITELCSIWMNLDKRSNIYKSLIHFEATEMDHTLHQYSETQSKLHSLECYDLPFICCSCNIAYIHNNFIYDHLKCKECLYYKCANCQLKESSEDDLIKAFIKDPKIRQECIRRIEDHEEKLPSVGLCIKKENPTPKIEFFKYFQYQRVKYLLGLTKGKIEVVRIITTTQDLQIFLSKFLVFEIKNTNQCCIKLSEESIKKQYILPKKVKACYKKQKQAIHLAKEQLQNQDIPKIFEGSKESRQKISILSVSDNKISRLNEIAKVFPNLIELQSSDNFLNNFQSIDLLVRLEKLNLRKCRIQKFPLELTNLKNLKYLKISENQIQIIPKEINKLENLQFLGLNNNCLENICQQIFQLKNLMTLNISRNKHVKVLSEAIGDLQNLQNLSISQLDLTKLPTSLKKLLKLSYLQANNNQFADICEDMVFLSKGIYFDFSCNHIEQIHEDVQFQKMQFLQNLNFQENYLEKMPNSINCKHLRKLNVRKNRISEISEANIESLINLQELNVSHNKLMQIPANIINLKQLLILDVSDCKLVNVGDWIGELYNLTHLMASHNLIEGVSVEIKRLTTLQVCILDKNKIKDFPTGLLQCYKLTRLSLAQNQIIKLPHHIGELFRLEYLDLHANQISQVPETLAQFRYLKTIIFYGNPLTSDICLNIIQTYGEGNTKQYAKLLQEKSFYNKNIQEKVLSVKSEIKKSQE